MGKKNSSFAAACGVCIFEPHEPICDPVVDEAANIESLTYLTIPHRDSSVHSLVTFFRRFLVRAAVRHRQETGDPPLQRTRGCGPEEAGEKEAVEA